MIRRLTPRFVPKVWGSPSLGPLYPDHHDEEPIGEVWFYDTGDPILIKFLFTTQKLSVQVHPDDAYAAQHHPSTGDASRGKTEMWHILAAEPDAAIAAGFQQPISRDQLRESALSGEIEQLIKWHPARPGDTFFIPSGTVHAIGPGLTLCEIQQNSDITYRLYDYGRPRELHLDHAVSVSNLSSHPGAAQADGETLVRCPYFTTERMEISKPTSIASSNQPQSVIVIAGTGMIGGQATRAGEVWRVEPNSGPTSVAGNLSILRVS